jgi:DNA-binding IclR family transcriptional regulator
MTTPATTVVSERALLILEIIARAEEPLTLNELMAQIELPKATTHRFASLLERLGFVQRTMDGKRYQTGFRLTELAIETMRHSFQMAPRRAILTGLVNEIAETCNITMLDGMELVYLDRVESDWPLQIRLKTGSHVPLHCTASGKLFLSLAPSTLRAAVQSHPLKKYTPQTIVDHKALDRALDEIRKTRIGVDNEEFIEGMTAIAVPVLDSKKNICATIAVHGPTVRLPMARAISLAPALRRAAKAVEQAFRP